MKIDAPGMYDLTDLEYHSDPCIVPSLSSSIAKVLLERSPRHAYLEHPRMGGRPLAQSSKLSLGSAVHSAVLKNDWDKIVIVDAKDWRTNKAKAERDQAYEEGNFPILAKQEHIVDGMVEAINAMGILDIDHQYGVGSYSEWTLAWKHNGDHWHRCKPDKLFLGPDWAKIMDFKTTEIPATEAGWGRRQVFEYMIQCGFYRWGVSILNPNIPLENITFEFVVQETSPPYEVQRFEFDYMLQNRAQMLVASAVAKWEQCMTSGKWPGYPRGKVVVEMPMWMIHKAEAEDDEC